MLAWSMDSAEPKDILTATAAILVVFVGTTLPAYVEESCESCYLPTSTAVL